MKKILYIKLVACIVLGLNLSSCSKWLDINTNPNVSLTTSAGYLFNYTAVSWSGARCSGDLYIPIAMASQLLADGLFDGGWSASSYVFNPATLTNTWVNGYANGVENLNKAILMAREEGNKNAEAQCKIMQAELYYSMTVIFGDVPFSQACQIEKYPTPVFDAQKDVLEGIVGLLDEAIALFDFNNPDCISTYDIYYKGDISRWEKLAYSMKLRILLLMVDKDPSKTADIATLLQDGVFLESAADDFVFPYFDVTGNKNPNYTLFEMAYARYKYDPSFWPHKVMVDPMVAMNDPRLEALFLPNKEGEYVGLETQESASVDAMGNTATTAMRNTFHIATTPDILFSYEEVQLMLAEVYLRGLGVGVDVVKADEHYHNAIKAACQLLKVEEDKIDEYLEGLPGLGTMTVEAACQAINIQFWIACVDRPLQAWVNQRRSGIPVLEVPKGVNAPAVFARYQYPERERNVNPNVPSPLPLLYDKMWFQK